ncbi:MAG: MBL fold metallo-hydrolase [Candidatus Eremiobacteraeota bacterium]|nr:MBL fold metallo-hydrolase [Candidatus Eremiobacteraeota bacterium]
MLEDEFSDIVRKASRGLGIDVATLASRTGLEKGELQAWIGGHGAPSDAEAREIARVLRLDPGKLADSAAQRWEPHTQLPADVRHHPQNPHPSNGYIFFLEDGKTAALVDPAGDPNNLRHAIAEGPYALRYILITHKHLDHCDATADVAKQFPDAKIVMHKYDAHAIGALASKALHVNDGDSVPFGDGAAIRLLHTPGHTDGSVCYLFKSTVFTGDTLFAGSVGGAFGDKSTYQDILNSVSTKLFKLDEETVVMPGHGPPSTIGQERQHNPFFNGF